MTGDQLEEILRVLAEGRWSVAIPKAKNSEDETPGMVIGTIKYVEWVLAQLPEEMPYSIFDPPDKEL